MNLNPFRKPRTGDGWRRTDDNVIPFDRAAGPGPTPMYLADMIEGEIIPRLLLAHDTHGRASPQRADRIAAREADVAKFAERSLTEDLEPLLADVLDKLEGGASFADVCFDILAPAARQLGDWWEQDRVSFTDVTVGLCRLQQIVYEVGDRLETPEPGADAPRVLFTLVPGDQHSFGLVLVSEFFRRAGWRTLVASDATSEELSDLVQGQRFDMVAFSVADEQRLTALPAVIATLRKNTRNPDMTVMVGGAVFEGRPERAVLAGADSFACDPTEAVRLAAASVSRAKPVA